MIKLLSLCMTVVCIASFTGMVNADNITIWDEDGYMGTGQGGEDNESEPRMIQNDFWDLESFDLVGNELGITGTFNLKDGYYYAYDKHTFTLGDIFIDVDGDAQFGTEDHRRALDSDRLNYGYDYAIRLTYGDVNTYNVYELKENGSAFEGVIEPLNDPESTPYKLALNDEQLTSSGEFIYSAGVHNSISGIDLSFLGNAEFIAHATMDCGNDNLMGIGNVSVPEPSMIGLLGIGLLSLVGFRRKYR